MSMEFIFFLGIMCGGACAFLIGVMVYAVREFKKTPWRPSYSVGYEYAMQRHRELLDKEIESEKCRDKIMNRRTTYISDVHLKVDGKFRVVNLIVVTENDRVAEVELLNEAKK